MAETIETPYSDNNVIKCDGCFENDVELKQDSCRRKRVSETILRKADKRTKGVE